MATPSLTVSETPTLVAILFVNHKSCSDQFANDERLGDIEYIQNYNSLDSDCVNDSQVNDVQGKIKAHKKFWVKELQASSFVSRIVTEGYVLPFVSLPSPVYFNNHKSAHKESEFVEQSIMELIDNRCVEVIDPPLVCSPLSVVTNASGKKRLVLDLRYVNQFLWKEKFKYEDLRTALSMFEKGDYFITFDLKSGYHHVDIEPHQWTYLGFSWQCQEVRKYFVFRVLPFGLATACYAFTKLLRPLVKYWRSDDLRVVVYLYDGIYVAATESEAIEASRRILKSAGLVINIIKSRFDPMQLVRWLGFIIDLCNGTIKVPEDRRDQLEQAIERAYGHDITVRQLAGIVGQIMAMGSGLGSITRLMTRACYRVINKRICWDEKVTWTEESRSELEFWRENVDQLNGAPIWYSPTAVRVVCSDASDTGYGGYSVEVGPGVAQGQWSIEESKRSSTWRELEAVRRVLPSLAPRMQGEVIKWLTDNQNVVRIVTYGSK